MKRFWITLLTVAMALVIALPATAKKPPKPSTAAPVAVYLDAGPIWVHEVGDVIRYSVAIQNKTTAAVTVDIAYPGGLEIDIEIGPSGVVTREDLFSHAVAPVEIATPVDIVETVTVSYPGGDVVASTSTDVYPEEGCKFTEAAVPSGSPPQWTAPLAAGEVCIWNPPPSSGEWTVFVSPDKDVTRPTRMMVSVRDGVPGNWCTDPDVLESGVVIRRLTPEDPVFKLHVLLPGDQVLPGLVEDGQCNSGGAGGDYFAVGNPDSFYLYTSLDGTATVSKGYQP